ncbi:MAG: aminoacyl-tRNA hydrolase [bacterium]|nr:aminoacyl-tRNA hydrolase [Deltaproteobacteria bacterium]MCP4906292.1 aminoacyl-tRNA hydrolase [bacterium]
MGRIRDFWSRLRGPRPEPVRAPSRLIVGLGNPGPQYALTRHNIGFRVVERLADRAGAEWREEASLDARVTAIELAGEDCLLLEPQTFMNRSGRSVAAACERWPDLDPTTDVFVVYDDLDLPTGRIRLRASGGGGGHRGIGDVLDELGTRALPRLRFGVGHPGSGEEVIGWVLGPFPEDEEAELPAAVDRAADAIESALRDGIPAAMGQFNGSS